MSSLKNAFWKGVEFKRKAIENTKQNTLSFYEEAKKRIENKKSVD
jgi:hypothetical protein